MKTLKIKEMKKQIWTIAVALIFAAFSMPSFGQEYKIPASGKSLKINFNEINKLEIEGTTGSEIIITTTDRSRAKDERATGLKAISSMGLEDNTGLGLSAVEKNGVVEVNSISRNSESRYIVKVPKNVSVKYAHNSPYGSDLKISNLESELDVSSLHNDVLLLNVTGPMTINTVHGDIDADFTTLNQASPTSIASVHGHVDVSVPASSKAELTIKTTWGEIFTDMDIQMDTSADMKRISSQTVRGKLNGGGVALMLSSTHDNIYLRKK
ncbi:MAG TPA: DUF4097 family beta strand repeat-containing protein [Cyclobacteriaceae bacterium]|jgi:hypothetical protein